MAKGYDDGKRDIYSATHALMPYHRMKNRVSLSFLGMLGGMPSEAAQKSELEISAHWRSRNEIEEAVKRFGDISKFGETVKHLGDTYPMMLQTISSICTPRSDTS